MLAKISRVLNQPFYFWLVGSLSHSLPILRESWPGHRARSFGFVGGDDCRNYHRIPDCKSSHLLQIQSRIHAEPLQSRLFIERPRVRL